MTEPPAQPDQQAERRVRCPFCGSQETEPHAMFGSLMLMEQHYCRACRTIFERVHDDEPDGDRQAERSDSEAGEHF